MAEFEAEFDQAAWERGLATMSQAQLNEELLECARYNEPEDLIKVIEAGGDIAHVAGGGNSALHYAAANGHVACVRELVRRGAPQRPNENGNLPLHWAVQNRHADVVRVLIDAKEVNVLEKNGFGRSPLTDGFSGGETSIVKALLEHPSATEEALLGGAKTEDVPADEAKGDEAEDASVTHELDLVSRREPAQADDDARAVVGPAPHADAGAPPLRVRELPMSDAKLFGSSAQDDTTGLGIWAASIVLARWAVDLGAARLGGRVVCELGAGCGVPGLAAALHCAPRRVILGDLNARALDNLRHNVALNGFGARPPAESAHADGTTPTVEIMPIEWEDPSTWPRAVDGADDGAAHVDVILGADLVYQASAVEPFVRAVSGMLRPGGECFYAGPESGRDGLAEVVSRMEAAGVELVRKVRVPEVYTTNPLASGDADACFLHFNELTQHQYEVYEFRKVGEAPP